MYALIIIAIIVAALAIVAVYVDTLPKQRK